MPRYWVAVASREHVKRGVAGGFAQVCHGKPGPLKQMAAGDWIVYYSSVERFGQKEPCRQFTAIGRVKSGEPYQFRMSDDFVPWRRDIAFLPAHGAPIAPLVEQLSFITSKRHWGFPFRRGCFFVPLSDFMIIAASMGVENL